MDESFVTRLEALIRAGWKDQDPNVRVFGRPREGGMVDLTVVSGCFEGMDSAEREKLFWPLMRSLPDADRLRMTYCLLLTPAEANRYFPEDASDGGA